MTSQQIRMLTEARRRHGLDITFCGDKKSWEDCFTYGWTYGKDTILLWYNAGPDTHNIIEEVEK